MSVSSSDKLTKEINELWLKHLPLIHSRIDTIRIAIKDLKNQQLSEDLRAKAMRDAHGLAGSLGTFGLQGASEAAAKIDRALQSSNCDAMAVERFLAQVEHAVDARSTNA